MQCNLPSSPCLFYNIFNENDIAPYGFVLVNFFGNSKKKKKKKKANSESQLIHLKIKFFTKPRNQRTKGQWAIGLWVVWPP